MSRSFSHIVLATLSTLMFAGMACTAMAADDPVIFHFDTMGDSRQAPGDPGLSPQDSIWLQDTRVLARVTREVQAGHAQAFVFNGDMISIHPMFADMFASSDAKEGPALIAPFG